MRLILFEPGFNDYRVVGEVAGKAFSVDTNAMAPELAMIAYNLPRVIGQESLKYKQGG